MRLERILVGLSLLLTPAPLAVGGERTERFDRDPGWESRNSRATHIAPRAIRQDFGFRTTNRAGGRAPGEVGGLITPAAEPASYARAVPSRTFDDRLTASGVLACDGAVHVLVGFFNAGTVNEWRTPNTIALRIQGRGDVFYAYLEYATSRWRAGGDSPEPFARLRSPETSRDEPRGFAARGASHRWTLEYDPNGNKGQGAITATIDGERSVCNLDAGHKADGAHFDRFGLLNVVKSVDSPGELWLDDLEINGEAQTFDRDPRWIGNSNERSYETANIRPRFDFGYASTRFAGGRAPGELGGLVFRGDCRDPLRLAAYGDRVGPLTLDRPLHASGRIALRRAVSDSTVLLGFYDSERSLATSPSQDSGFPEHFLGLAVEGPSRDGFFVYPAYRTVAGDQGYADGPERPHILPDGAAHDWALDYTPTTGSNPARLRVSLDGRASAIDLPPGGPERRARFDRFGLVTTWIDGNGQVVYFDDLTYTASPDER